VAGVETIQRPFPLVAVACLSVLKWAWEKALSQDFRSFLFPLGDVQLLTKSVTVRVAADTRHFMCLNPAPRLRSRLLHGVSDLVIRMAVVRDHGLPLEDSASCALPNHGIHFFQESIRSPLTAWGKEG